MVLLCSCLRYFFAKIEINHENTKRVLLFFKVLRVSELGLSLDVLVYKLIRLLYAAVLLTDCFFLYVLLSADSEFPYLHTLEELFYGISLIHPLDIDQRGMHGFLGFLNRNSLVAFFLIDD